MSVVARLGNDATIGIAVYYCSSGLGWRLLRMRTVVLSLIGASSGPLLRTIKIIDRMAWHDGTPRDVVSCSVWTPVSPHLSSV